MHYKNTQLIKVQATQHTLILQLSKQLQTMERKPHTLYSNCHIIRIIHCCSDFDFASLHYVTVGHM